MKVRTMGTVLAGIVLTVLASQAMATPSAWYMYNGQYFGIDPNAWSQDGSGGNWSCNFQNLDPNGEFSISGNVSMSDDPQIIYGISATCFANGAANFSFGFTDTWVTPLTQHNRVYASWSGSCTDGTGDGVTIVPLSAGGKMQVTDLNGTNMTVDVGNGYASGAGFPGQSYDAGVESKGPKAGPLGSWTQMNTVLAFSLSGHNDVATMNGSSVIVPAIPEPASALLLLPGLLGVAMWRRKRS